MESLPVEMRRMIMDNLSNAELLTISLVNKLFNSEARTLLKDRASFIANLNCQNIWPFIMHYFQAMNAVPFSGIKFRGSDCHHRDECSSPKEVLDPFGLDSLDRMPIKRLSVEFHGGQYLPENCPVFQLVKQILQDYSRGLEEIEVSDRPKLLQFIQDAMTDSLFPRLKILKLICPPGRKLDGPLINCGFLSFIRCKEYFIREIKVRAPNLREVIELDELTI